MRIFNLNIDGENYKACCGLRALSEIQRKYGNLKEFENKIVPDEVDNTNIDIQLVIDTAILFLKEGAMAAGKDAPNLSVIYSAADPLGLAAQLFTIYVRSLIPENEDDEKNVVSQTIES